MLSLENLENLLRDYREKSEQDILSEGDYLVCQLANESLKTTEAYRKHVESSIGNLSGPIESIESFKLLPPTEKQEYLKKYNRSDLIPLGNFGSNSWNISATSGSTGEPFYFPRDNYQDLVYARTAETYLVNNFGIDNKTTLYINAFPMGIWIGGVFTYTAINEVMRRGYNLSIVNPGINKAEVIRVIKNLSSEFDQIVIGSYAPFLKDILDDAIAEGIDWKQLSVKFVFSAEAFSEEFRDYLSEKTGINPLVDTLNHYGTVDLGTMSHETPYSILIRRLAYKNRDLFRELFGEEARTPTLTQFDPRLFYFEEVDGRLYCTAKTGYSMIRYDLKDKGGVRLKSDIEGLFSKHGINLAQEAEQAGIGTTIWNLPFVFVYERADFSVSYYAFQVYPEVIRKALIDSQVNDTATGKFTAEVVYVDGRQQLNLYIEMRPEQDLDENNQQKIQDIIHNYLKDGSSEYRQTCDSLGDEIVKPIVILKPYEDMEYFKPGAKQKWVKK